MLFVLKCVHAGPKAVVTIADQLSSFEQSAEGLDYEFLFLAYIAEYFRFENEKTAIDADAPVVDSLDICHQVFVSLLQRNRMIA